MGARLVAGATEFGQVGRRVDLHPRRPLQERLDDDGADLPSPLGETALHGFEARDVASLPLSSVGTAEAVRRRDLQGLHHQRGENGAVKAESSDGQRPQRLAVIAVGEGEKRLAPGVTPKAVILKAHLEGHLDGGRPVVGEENPLQAGRCQGDNPLGQLNGRTVAEIAEDAVGQFLGLTAQRPVETIVVVAEKVDPPGGDGIETTPPLDVVEPDTFPPVDDKGGMGLVILHLGTGMPDAGQIAALEIFYAHRCGSFHLHRSRSNHSRSRERGKKASAASKKAGEARPPST